MKLARVVSGLTLVALVAAGCGSDEGGDTGAAVENTVNVQAFDFYFDPTSLNVDVGAEVTIDFTNSGSVVHSWTSSDLDVEVEAGAGEESSVTFVAPAEPGSYDYFCEYHPDEMQGTISIGGSDEEVEEVPDDGEDEDVDVEVDTDEDTGAGTDDY